MKFTIPDEFTANFDEIEQRRKLIKLYGDSQSMFSGVNQDGETVFLSVDKDEGIILKTYQNNSHVRVNYYDKNGYMEGETYEGRWQTNADATTINKVSFEELLPGSKGSVLDSYFKKEGWELQLWVTDKSVGYQVYFGAGVQVDNNFEYGFQYLYDKDEAVAFANDFYDRKISKGSLSDKINAARARGEGMGSESVISAAHFAENDEIKDTVLESDVLRNKALDVCYSIPGYKELSLDEKNRLYDLVQKSISSSKENIMASSSSKPWKVFFETFDEAGAVNGRGMLVQQYARKGNAERKANEFSNGRKYIKCYVSQEAPAHFKDDYSLEQKAASKNKGIER